MSFADVLSLSSKMYFNFTRMCSKPIIVLLALFTHRPERVRGQETVKGVIQLAKISSGLNLKKVVKSDLNR